MIVHCAGDLWSQAEAPHASLENLECLQMAEKKMDLPPSMEAQVMRRREDLDAEAQAAMEAFAAEQAGQEAQRPPIQAEGEAA